MNTDPTFIAVVQYGDDAADIGAVFAEGPHLVALFPGHDEETIGADVVTRDRRGWLWDEYGDDEYPVGRGRTGNGTRLPVVSRSKAWGATILATWQTRMDAMDSSP